MRKIGELNHSSEKRTFFQWINFAIPYIYTTGIFLILTWMMIAFLLLGMSTIKENPKSLFLQPDIANENTPNIQNTNNETAFSIIIKPFVESNFHQIIFQGLFLLIVWVLLFLTIPIAFKRLKRFKFLNLEFEVDNIELAAIETVEISGTKAKLMAYFTGDDASGRTLEFLFHSAIDFKEVLEYFLKEMQIGYKNPPINGAFTYEVNNSEATEKLADLIGESRETGEAVIHNKIDENNLLKKNYLVFYFSYNHQEYVTIIESYTYSFDILDKYLFELLHRTIARNVENIEYMVALTTTDDQFVS